MLYMPYTCNASAWALAKRAVDGKTYFGCSEVYYRKEERGRLRESVTVDGITETRRYFDDIEDVYALVLAEADEGAVMVSWDSMRCPWCMNAREWAEEKLQR